MLNAHGCVAMEKMVEKAALQAWSPLLAALPTGVFKHFPLKKNMYHAQLLMNALQCIAMEGMVEKQARRLSPLLAALPTAAAIYSACLNPYIFWSLPPNINLFLVAYFLTNTTKVLFRVLQSAKGFKH